MLDVMLRLGVGAAPQPHVEGLAAAAEAALLDMEPGPWWPTRAFYGGAVMALLDEQTRELKKDLSSERVVVGGVGTKQR